MLLAIDVGNTNITIGVYDGEKLEGIFRLMSKSSKTSDEYGVMIKGMLEAKGIDPKKIEAAIIVSVVPNLMHSLINGIYKYFNVKVINVGPGIKTGIKIGAENPKEVGADRIVDAVAAYEIYGGPVLVIDFGTATTYDFVTEDGTLSAAITSPGIRICANALWNEAAKLPEIEIKKPKSILAKETISSMQAGLVYGYIGQTEYIIKKVKEETKIPDLKVVATGGLGKIIFDETDKIDVYNKDLTLEGLRLIYNKQ